MRTQFLDLLEWNEGVDFMTGCAGHVVVVRDNNNECTLSHAM